MTTFPKNGNEHGESLLKVPIAPRKLELKITKSLVTTAKTARHLPFLSIKRVVAASPNARPFSLFVVGRFPHLALCAKLGIRPQWRFADCLARVVAIGSYSFTLFRSMSCRD
jgi:hypothetical protein